MKIIILIVMFFCHIVDDYYLQGCLANMKQKAWWQIHTSNKLYKYDYIMALLEHAFSWSFMVMLPVLIYMIYNNELHIGLYVAMLVGNLIVHSIIDNCKANELCINLITDQCLHFIQIVLTWWLFIS